MRQGDYSSYSSYYNHHYPQNPNPNPAPLVDQQLTSPLHASPYASAPPFSTSYPPPSHNFAAYPSNYPSFPHNTGPAPSLSPTVPSYSPNPDLQAHYNPHFETHVPYRSHLYNPTSYDQHQSNAISNYNFDSGVKLGQSGYGQSGGDLGLGRYDPGDAGEVGMGRMCMLIRGVKLSHMVLEG
ncbi:hypothetical protein DCAR_0519128 [Daucus carota subsp. sativus]|uniref:Uncharacterized protein n=1 Tax=Daucus carota subsp. sativus TaxID=79200 RepID=A0A164XQS7_DAUCS|nr:hypothetical protein DCAR_0519128 [Daucus carota subsp. sativus]